MSKLVKKMKLLRDEIKIRISKYKRRKNKKKWAIIGLGHMANVFAKILTLDKNSYVYAVASRSMDKANKFGKKYNVKFRYDDYRKMIDDLKDEIDIIYIATPENFHFEPIQYSLNNNVNVLCEKPIVKTSKQFQQLLKIAKTNSVLLMEGMWFQTLPTYIKTKEIIDSNIIGDIKLIVANLYKNNKISNPNYSVLRDYGIYPIFLSVSLMKEIPIVKFVNKASNFDCKDTDWQINLSNSKISSHINISSNFISSSNAAIIGSKGSIQFHSQFNRTNIIEVYDEKGSRVKKYKYKYRYSGYEHEIKEVNNTIENGISLIDMEKSFKTISVLEKIENYKF